MNHKIIIGILIVLILIIGITLFKDASAPDYLSTFQTKELSFQGNSHTFLVADTPAKWEQGLMNIKKLNEVDGMIFEFPDLQTRSFWNKNTLMHLTLYWMYDNQVIGTSDLPSITQSKDIVTVTSPGPANRVIEMPYTK